MKSEKEFYKFSLKMKIFSIYLIMIVFAFYLAIFTGGITILITIPIAIIIAKKITKGAKLELKRFDYLNFLDNEPSQNKVSQILSYSYPYRETYTASTTKSSLTKDYKKIDNIYVNQSLNYNFSPTFSEINYRNYYRPKRYITTLNELHFYEVLLEIAKELDLVLFCQVSLYSIIEPKKSLDYSTRTKFFNKINRKSIDFVLADKKTCRTKLCIELDDSTHYRRKRIERDEFLDELFKQLEINILRYPVRSVYNKDSLKHKILENIKDHYYID